MRRTLNKLANLLLALVFFLASPPTQAKVELRLGEQHTHTGEIRALTVCGQQVLVATSGGLAVHERASGRFLRKLTSADGIPGNSLKAVACMAEGHALVGGEFGAAVLKLGEPWRARPVSGLGGAERYTPVTGLLSLGPESMRLVVMQRGLMRLQRDGGGQRFRALAGSSAPAWWHAAACGPDSCALGDLAGTLALAPRTSLDALRAPVDTHSRLILDGAILGILAQENYFVVATGQALIRVEGTRIRPLTAIGPEGHLDRVRATALAKAEDGILVGTADGIVYKLTDTQLTAVARTDLGRVTALAMDGKKIWLGIARSGLHLIEPGSGEPGLSLRPAGEICDNHVTRLTRHRRWLIAGTFDQGACALTARGWVPLPELPSPMVLGLASDGTDLYLATANGIARYGSRLQPRPIGRRDAKTLQWLATEPATGAAELGPGRVALTSKFGVVRIWKRANKRTRIRFTNHDNGAPWKMTGITAGGGELFAYSETQGVKRLDVGGLPEWHLTDPRPLSENWITSVDTLSATELWVATCQRGAVHIDGKRAKRIGKRQGLPDERLTAIAAHPAGAFLGTLNGLVFAPAGDNGRLRTWNVADGIPDPRSASLLLEGDVLWLATEAGLARFCLSGKELASR